jgi:amino acid adenylation domain-containing protein
VNDDKVELLRGLSPEQRAMALDTLKRGALEAQQATLVRPLEHGSAIPLSLAQQRLWLLERLQPGGRAYNELSALRVDGPLDVAVLERSLSEIVRRHAPLRTTFPVVDGKPVQAIAPARPLTIPVTDLRRVPAAEREAEVERLIGEESGRPLELDRGPLLRVSLLRLEDEHHVLLVAAHHIILDGWSMGIFRRELSQLYRAYLTGRPSPLAPLPVQYADFAVWERARLKDEDLETQLRYWTRQLAGTPPVLQLHVVKPRPAQETFRGGRLYFALGDELSNALKALGKQVGVTLFATLLGGFQILLARYSGQTDVPVGTVVAKRDRAEIENLIGFFVNTLVMRGDLSGDPTVAELLKRVSRVALEAYEAQDVPFEQVVEALQPKRAPGYHPLFQALFSLHKTAGGAADDAALALTPIPLTEVTAKFDLILTVEETAAGLEAYWEYNRDLFERETVERMSDHLRTLLRGMAARPDARVAELPLLAGAERRRLLGEWSVDGAPLAPDARRIHQVFEGQAARTPAAPAVVCGDDEMAYGELNRRANVLARRLRALGVRAGGLVALYVPRSLDTVVGMLAVLKAGGAYVPLDPAYPAERLAEIVADARPAVLLTTEELRGALPSGEAPVVCLDAALADDDPAAGENPAFAVGHDDLAYVIYTSGSSGRPKGVMITHGNLMHSTAARWSFYDDPVDAFLLLSSFAFDSSVAGTYWTLTQGGTLVVVPDPVLVDVPALRALIAARRVTHLLAIPSLYAALLDGARPGELDVLRVAIVAGETCRATTVEAHQRALPHAALFNEYGPTEATVWSTVYRCDGAPRDPVPIGRPSPGTRVFILDARLEPVPVGLPGELHVGGPAVARGYLNRPDLTREKFVTVALDDVPLRLYKTGDVARYRADGQIVLVGRTDQQVKVRGFRVELGEIESALAQIPGVREAVAAVRESAAGDRRLVAYAECAEPGAVNARELQRLLAGKLPAHAVPADLEVLEALPRLPNGKVDRANLPEPGASRSAAEPVGEEWSELERALAEVWKSTLNIDTVGRSDNFFEVGGDSLTIIRVYNRVREFTGGDVLITDLFKYPTIEGLADFIGSGSETGSI